MEFEVKDNKKDMLDHILKYRKVLPKEKLDTEASYEHFYDMFAGQESPVSKKQLKEIEEAMIDFFLNDSRALSIESFIVRSGIPAQDIRRWGETYDSFRRAMKFCKNVIFERKDYGAHTNKLNANYVKYSMPFYSQDYRDEKDKEIKRNQQDNEPVKVIIDNIGSNNGKKG